MDIDEDNNAQVVEVVLDEEDNIQVLEDEDDDLVEVVELGIEDIEEGELIPAQEEVIPDEIVDIQLADALAELEFGDLFDVLDPNVDEEIEPIAPGGPVQQPIAHVPMIDCLAGVQHELPQQHNIGALNEVCRHCNARHFASERISQGHFFTCCNNGHVSITGNRVLYPPSERLMSLLVDDSQEGRHFKLEIRRYNNTLAFAAFSSDFNPRHLPGPGPRVFTVHGQVYRRVTNDIVRNDQRQPRYCKLYFIESATANQIRMQQQPPQHPLFESLIEALDAMLRNINPYAMAFE